MVEIEQDPKLKDQNRIVMELIANRLRIQSYCLHKTENNTSLFPSLPGDNRKIQILPKKSISLPPLTNLFIWLTNLSLTNQLLTRVSLP